MGREWIRGHQARSAPTAAQLAVRNKGLTFGYDAYDVVDVGYETPCWIFRKKQTGRGYAQMWVDGVQTTAHRAYYMHYVGPIPEGMTLDHLCRNRPCVNPDHMDICTRGENVLRGEGISAQNARKTHCHRGHSLAPEDGHVYINPYDGSRQCTTCVTDDRHARQDVARAEREAAKRVLGNEIREARKEGTPYSELCDRFGLSRTQLKRVIHEGLWS